MVEPPEPTRRVEPMWLDPYPDVLLEGLANTAPGPEARYETRESVGLAFAAALLGVTSSEASAASSFVCQAVGPRSVGYGRAYFVADAKWQALIRCERYSGICIISYCVPAY